MPTDRNSQKIVIAGASSLLGNEVKALLEESRFAGWDLHLVDEEDAAGTLTEAGGEAAVIQRVEEGTFRRARFAFLTGSKGFGKTCLRAAGEAGATVIDFSHATLEQPDAVPWFPKLEALTGKSAPRGAKAFSVFGAAGTAIASLALALRKLGLRRLTATILRPVSESGRAGIEDLETQTSQLLSFQPAGSRVFGTQAAFAMLAGFGAESRENVAAETLEVRAEVSAALSDADEDRRVSIQMVHAPVFYGMTFSACADLDAALDLEKLSGALREAGFVLPGQGEAGPSNVSVAGEKDLYLGEPRKDAVREGAWWFWGAADNLKLPAANGVKLAEWLEG